MSAFSRTPAKLDVTHPALTKVAGDFHDAASVRSAVAGHDAVIICASPSSLGTIKEKPDYFSRGTKYCIDAMKEHGVKRLVVLSAHGVGESKPAASWFQRTFLIGGLLKGFFRDHDVQERMTQESGLDFVIARPTRLTNGKAKGKYVRTAELISVPAIDLPRRRRRLHGRGVRVDDVGGQGRAARRVTALRPRVVSACRMPEQARKRARRRRRALETSERRQRYEQVPLLQVLPAPHA